MNITFGPATTKGKKTWKCALNEDTHLEGCSEQLQHMIMSVVELTNGFTLEELARRAHKNGMKCKTKSNIDPDFHAIGYTHRPKLIEMGVIVSESTSQEVGA